MHWYSVVCTILRLIIFISFVWIDGLSLVHWIDFFFSWKFLTFYCLQCVVNRRYCIFFGELDFVFVFSVCFFFFFGKSQGRILQWACENFADFLWFHFRIFLRHKTDFNPRISINLVNYRHSFLCICYGIMHRKRNQNLANLSKTQ